MNQRWSPEGAARGRVVLLHGIMSTAATWWRVGPALASRGWVVDALDLPGHGDWSRSARPLGMDALVDGIAGRLRGPVDLLVGHSLGGAVAVALAGRHPRAARALVLEDPPTRSREDHAATLAAGIEADARLVRRDRRRVVRREREANPAWADEDVEHSVDGSAAADTAALAAGLRASWPGTCRPWWPRSGSRCWCWPRRPAPGPSRPGAAPSRARPARPCGPSCRRTGSWSSTAATASTATSPAAGWRWWAGSRTPSWAPGRPVSPGPPAGS
ncbi:MAG TPA: alpha/beta fold hydrolase, partial [Actinomycetota bacterium]|nr:alpha/beta fold hydrolase [Actinomycetota bacterium]